MAKKEAKETAKKTTKKETTKKTTAKKATTKKAEPKKTTKKARDVKRSDSVEVFCNTTGTVSMHTASGRPITFNRVGQVRDVLVDDLEQVLAVAPIMITGGVIYIEDEDVRKFLGVDELYENKSIYKYDELEDILELSDDELAKSLATMNSMVKDDVARLAIKNKDNLTVNQVRVFRNNGVFIALE